MKQWSEPSLKELEISSTAFWAKNSPIPDGGYCDKDHNGIPIYPPYSDPYGDLPPVIEKQK